MQCFFVLKILIFFFHYLLLSLSASPCSSDVSIFYFDDLFCCDAQEENFFSFVALFVLLHPLCFYCRRENLLSKFADYLCSQFFFSDVIRHILVSSFELHRRIKCGLNFGLKRRKNIYFSASE